MRVLRRIFAAVTRSRETGWLFTALVSIPYLAYLIWMHAHHEMWRDEMHAWTLSRLAQSFGELVTGDRIYEGHPPLWFWYLHVWSWLTDAAWGIQAATIVAAMTATVVLLRFAPFPRYLKVLVLASYLFAYEYTVMSRNYVLGWLLVCVFCALYHPLRTRRVVLAVVLVLLSLTSVMGLALSLALLLFLILDGAHFARGGRGMIIDVSFRLVAVGAVMAVGLAFCLYSLHAPDPNMFDPGWRLDWLNVKGVPRMFSRIGAGFFPNKPFSTDFFDFGGKQVVKPPKWFPYLAGGTLFLCLLSLIRSWRLLLAYLAGVLMLAVVQTLRYEGHVRHWGHYLVLFVAACWLMRSAFPRRRHVFSLLLLLVIAGFQVKSTVAVAIWETRGTFSGAKETASFIEKNNLQNMIIVGGASWIVPAVTGYLRRPYLNIENEEVSETIVFHARRRKFPSTQAYQQGLLEGAIATSRERQEDVLVISTLILPPAPHGVTCSLLYTSPRGAIPDEVFRVYRINAPIDPDSIPDP